MLDRRRPCVCRTVPFFELLLPQGLRSPTAPSGLGSSWRRCAYVPGYWISHFIFPGPLRALAPGGPRSPLSDPLDVDGDSLDESEIEQYSNGEAVKSNADYLRHVLEEHIRSLHDGQTCPEHIADRTDRFVARLEEYGATFSETDTLTRSVDVTWTRGVDPVSEVCSREDWISMNDQIVAIGAGARICTRACITADDVQAHLQIDDSIRRLMQHYGTFIRSLGMEPEYRDQS